ncbi:MAG: hypothetical protein WKF91_20660 [Segetibacter sp.]
MKMLLANIFTLTGAAIFLIFGLAYLYKSASVNNHCGSIRKDLEELTLQNKTLLFALMRGVAAGSLAVAVTIIFLQLQFLKNPIKWIPLIILISSSIFFLISINAMILVKRKTSIKPPIILLMLAMLFIAAGYFASINV